MNIAAIPAGHNPPNDINVVIEIPAMHAPVKYEIEKESGAVFVDRFMPAPMFYPANYGFIPNTLAGDGDPLDVLVIAPFDLVVGCVVRARPIGVLRMTDDSGEDFKVVAVPHKKLTTFYDHIDTIDDLPPVEKQRIEHFFSHYKQLEKDKWVKIDRWGDIDEARTAVMESLQS